MVLGIQTSKLKTPDQHQHAATIIILKRLFSAEWKCYMHHTVSLKIPIIPVRTSTVLDRHPLDNFSFPFHSAGTAVVSYLYSGMVIKVGKKDRQGQVGQLGDRLLQWKNSCPGGHQKS